MTRPWLALLVALPLAWQSSRAATCANEDFEFRVSGVSQCLLMRRFGTPEPDVMVAWLHGDVSSGGPANYHFSIAEQAALALSGAKVMSVALVRPGYPDGTGDSSTVALLQAGRSDHYTRENIAEVGEALQRLRARYKPRRLIVVGHSGGAATAAVLLGLKPHLIDGAVLVSCPCDLTTWRARRKAWGRSEDPMKWAQKVEPSTKVIALTGERDDNTSPDLARKYVNALEAGKVDATFRALPEDNHNSAFRSPEVIQAVRDLISAK